MAEANVEEKPNLLDCEASELAAYLLQHRFNDNGMATASFLLECTSTLPNAEAISTQLMGQRDDDDNGDNGENEEATEEEEEESPEKCLGNPLTETCTVSMTAPRGKFQMTLLDGGVQFVNAKGDALVITSARRIVVFPSPQDCRLKKKDGANNMVLLCLDEDTTSKDKVAAASPLFQNKSCTQVCFALPADTTDPSMVAAAATWIELLCKSLSLPEREVIMAQNHQGYTFESFKEGNTSTTTGGMPFVQCYYGVKDGVLFPMKQGLLFFKYVRSWGEEQCLHISCVCVCLSRIIIILTHLTRSSPLLRKSDHPCFCIGLSCIPLRVDVDRVDRDTWTWPSPWRMKRQLNLPTFIAMN